MDEANTEVSSDHVENALRTELGRRQLAKLLAITGGVSALQASLPVNWLLPEIGIGVLPAHAVGSCDPGGRYYGERAYCAPAGSDSVAGQSGGAGKSGNAGTGAAGMNGDAHDASTPMDSRTDAAISGGHDAGMDAAMDSDASLGTDAGSDAGSDADVDADMDAGNDAAADADVPNEGGMFVPKPTGLVITGATDTTIDIAWDQGGQFDFYDVNYGELGTGAYAGGFTFMNSGGGVHMRTLSGLTPNITYQINLRGLAGCCAGKYVSVTGMTLSTATPGMPTLDSQSGNTVNIAWGMVSGAYAYRVQRSVDAYAWSNLTPDVIGDSNTTFSDTDTKSGGTYYYYRVSAVDSGGTPVSGWSQYLSVLL